MVNIYAVVVTFNPNISNLENLIKDVSINSINLILIDNGSDNQDDIKILKNNYSIDTIFLKQNLGIAAAQNIGINYCIDNNVGYIIFFDQDSTIDSNFIFHLYADYKSLVDQGIAVGLIGPKYIDPRFNFIYSVNDVTKYGILKKINLNEMSETTSVKLLISSGSLIAVDTIKKVGLLRENYFIDCVDTEWCFRIESLGFKNFVSKNAMMYHTIGDNLVTLGPFKSPLHSPFRRYFIIRNSFYMLKESHIPVLFSFRMIFFSFYQQFLILLRVNKRSEYFKVMLKGTRDGLKYLFLKSE
ncbi:glycosyltransferase family 2 protein [Acinetobacter ihumii]|uniref:glycosyltransferase family 2 protein n=1 Tax=Acinetobacter ihumii TaxID=2483802 RepID=UPI00102FDA9A|nr:glycosyltransferase family 2 protein [Acinetobacter ihumii]